MRTTLTAVSLCTSMFVVPSQANAEEWQCQLREPPPSTSNFDYDILLESPTSARIEVTPSKLGVNPLDDEEARTSWATIVQNSPDGFVLVGTGAGPTRYGRGVYASLLVFDRRNATAAWTYAMSAEKVAFANPPRLGNCTRR